jgi:hypothetical protein
MTQTIYPQPDAQLAARRKQLAAEDRIAEKVRSHFHVPTIGVYIDAEGHVVEREDA